MSTLIIDFRHDFNLQAKKYDFVKIAWILSHIDDFVSANQINYYFNRIFPQNYCNSLRISQVIRQKKDLFQLGKMSNGMTNTYRFIGELKLNPTTYNNWKQKSKSFF